MKTPKRILIGTLIALVAMVSTRSATAEQKANERAAIAAQIKAFMDAAEHGDAAGIAKLFTSDAKLIVQGIDQAVTGRGPIEKFWQTALSRGVKYFHLTTIDLEGAGALRVETGTYKGLAADGTEIGRGKYLFVWKQEGGEWKIYRDMGFSDSAPTGMRSGLESGEASAPTIDRVGFPKNYPATFKLLGVSLRNQEPAMLTVYGNAPVASVKSASQLPYPNGSIIIMEWANTLKDDEGTFVRDSKGEPRAGNVVRIDVMRRGNGFGEAYGANRAGEWEFVSYEPNGKYLTPPEKSAECAACHAKAGSEKDFVFRLRVPGTEH